MNITPANDPPQAFTDNYTTSEDTPLLVNAPGVILNDQDIDSDALAAILDTHPVTGVLSLQPDGGLSYLPPPNYNGAITFTYHLTDGLAFSNQAEVWLNITPANDPPLAVDDAALTPEDTPVAIAVLANDFDIDGDPLSLDFLSHPVHGSTVISGTFALYTPALNFTGQDVFTYTISDGQAGEATASVTITVGGVNDPPVVEAGDDQVALEGELVAFNGSFSDDGRAVGNRHALAAGEQVVWEFGDGISAAGILTPTHVYADDGIYTVTLVITDSGGAVGQDWLAVAVSNVAPLPAKLPDRTVRVGQLLTVTSMFTDPGWLDTYEGFVEWEPAITETLPLAAGERQFELEHRYSRAGTYTVTIRIMDDDHGLGTLSFEVAVIPWKIFLPVMRK